MRQDVRYSTSMIAVASSSSLLCIMRCIRTTSKSSLCCSRVKSLWPCSWRMPKAEFLWSYAVIFLRYSRPSDAHTRSSNRSLCRRMKRSVWSNRIRCRSFCFDRTLSMRILIWLYWGIRPKRQQKTKHKLQVSQDRGRDWSPKTTSNTKTSLPSRTRPPSQLEFHFVRKDWGHKQLAATWPQEFTL